MQMKTQKNLKEFLSSDLFPFSTPNWKWVIWVHPAAKILATPKRLVTDKIEPSTSQMYHRLLRHIRALRSENRWFSYDDHHSYLTTVHRQNRMWTNAHIVRRWVYAVVQKKNDKCGQVLSHYELYQLGGNKMKEIESIRKLEIRGILWNVVSAP